MCFLSSRNHHIRKTQIGWSPHPHSTIFWVVQTHHLGKTGKVAFLCSRTTSGIFLFVERHNNWKYTQNVSITKINRLMLFRKVLFIVKFIWNISIHPTHKMHSFQMLELVVHTLPYYKNRVQQITKASLHVHCKLKTSTWFLENS